MKLELLMFWLLHYQTIGLRLVLRFITNGRSFFWKEKKVVLRWCTWHYSLWQCFKCWIHVTKLKEYASKLVKVYDTHKHWLSIANYHFMKLLKNVQWSRWKLGTKTRMWFLWLFLASTFLSPSNRVNVELCNE